MHRVLSARLQFLMGAAGGEQKLPMRVLERVELAVAVSFGRFESIAEVQQLVF